jgi:hypothetical protein
MSEVIKDVDGNPTDQTLDQLGTCCRENLDQGIGQLAEAARIAVQAKLRIERGEQFPGNFERWYEVYCERSLFSQAKLLTYGGWKEAKKTGEVPSAEAVTEKIETVRAARAAHMRDVRQKEKSSREPGPATSAHERWSSLSVVDHIVVQIEALTPDQVLEIHERVGKIVERMTAPSSPAEAVPEPTVTEATAIAEFSAGDPDEPDLAPPDAGVTRPAAAPPVCEAEPRAPTQPSPKQATPAPSAVPVVPKDNGWVGTVPKCQCDRTGGICGRVSCKSIGRCQWDVDSPVAGLQHATPQRKPFGVEKPAMPL